MILGFAADRPDDDDPAEGRPGARSRTWRRSDPEFPGVSESFPRELALTFGVGRGTAAHRLRRAFTLRHSLPLTEAAQRRGELDERRVQILADTLEHIAPALAGRVEAIVLPEACELGFGALERRILDVLLELDPESADANRACAEAGSDVFVQPGLDGRATLGAQLNADEATSSSTPSPGRPRPTATPDRSGSCAPRSARCWCAAPPSARTGRGRASPSPPPWRPSRGSPPNRAASTASRSPRRTWPTCCAGSGRWACTLHVTTPSGVTRTSRPPGLRRRPPPDDPPPF